MFEKEYFDHLIVCKNMTMLNCNLGLNSQSFNREQTNNG